MSQYPRKVNVRGCFALCITVGLVTACSGGGGAPVPRTDSRNSSATVGGAPAAQITNKSRITGTIRSGDAFPAPYDPVKSGYVPPKVDLHPTAIMHDPMLQVHLDAVTRGSSLAKGISSTARVSQPLDVVSVDDSGGQAGYYIYGVPGAGNGDIWAAMDAVTPNEYYNVYLPSPNTTYGNYLYAPTTHGPNGNCIETVTDYFDNTGSGGTTYYDVMVWNFCQAQNGQPQQKLFPMDQNFFNTYVETYTNGDGRPEYISQVYVDADHTWHQLLYDNVTKVYDDIDDLSGSATNNGDMGWSLFETHFSAGTTCPSIPTIGMSGLRVQVNGTWNYLSNNPTIAYPGSSQNMDCFNPANPPFYEMNYYSPDYAWTENDPSVPGSGVGSLPKPTPTGPNCVKNPSLCE